MRVLLSNPPWFPDNGARWGIRAGSRWPFTVPPGTGYYPYPFLLGYATSYLRSHRIDAYMVDSILVRESLESYYRRIQEIGFDWVIIETSTPSIDYDLSIAERITKLSPSTRVALAGAHPAVFAEDTLKRPSVYAVLKGEFEKNSLKLVTTEQPGVYDYDLIDDLSASPYPYRDSTIYRYTDRFPNTPEGPQLQMWASRGCPFKCVFCLWPPTMYENKTRYRDPDSLLREVEWAFANFPRFTSVYFDDDTFNIGNDRVQEIARGMKKLGIPWAAMCRADTSSLETFQVMAESGCYAVKFGIESGAQSLVDNCSKRLDLERVRDSVRLLKSLGVWVHTTWTWGLPGETRDTIKATQRFFRDIRPSSAQESLCTPFPGTPYYDALSKSGNLVLEGWDQLDGARSTVIESAELSSEDLRTYGHLRVRVFVVVAKEAADRRSQTNDHSLGEGRALPSHSRESQPLRTSYGQVDEEIRTLARAVLDAGYHPICSGNQQTGSSARSLAALDNSSDGDILLVVCWGGPVPQLPEGIPARKILYLADDPASDGMVRHDWGELARSFDTVIVRPGVDVEEAGGAAADPACMSTTKPKARNVVHVPDNLSDETNADLLGWMLSLGDQ